MEFTMPKATEKLEQPYYCEKGVYLLTIKKVSLEPNKAGTGNNIVVESSITGEADSKANRLTFKKWLSMPNPSDEGKFWGGGVPAADGKQKSITDFAIMVGGSAKGKKVDIPTGGRFRHMVEKVIDPDNPERIYNELSGYPMSAGAEAIHGNVEVKV